MPVPRAFVGVVIGRNGEIIKRITAETGAKVQFKQGKVFQAWQHEIEKFMLIFMHLFS